MTSAFVTPATPLVRTQQFTSTKRCPTRTYPICRVAQPKQSLVTSKPSPIVESVAQLLRQDLEAFFDPQHPNDYSLYSTHFSFEDPLTKINGVNKYEKHITFLERSILFSDAQFNLLDMRVIGDRLDTIRTRWYLSLTVNLPWRPCVTFTGQSDYVVDVRSRKICKQFDYWDSLDDSSFFSVAAVNDFVTQLVPTQPSLNHFQRFNLLRRTRRYEIRNFDNQRSELTLVPHRNSSSAVPVWRTSKRSDQADAKHFNNVAVMKLSAPPRSERQFAVSERTLRCLLSDVSFALPGNNCVYVQDIVKGRPVHELWLELSEANANVDF